LPQLQIKRAFAAHLPEKTTPQNEHLISTTK